MLIFQNTSLFEYSIGFFLFGNNSSLLSEKYWSTLAVVSTALIGFSLTAYNVYRTRIERAAADPICRKYSFIEDSFTSSWRLMIIAMMMFLTAFSISLYFVVMNPNNINPSELNPNNINPSEEHWLSIIQYAIYGLLGWATYCCLSLYWYIFKVLRCVYKTTINNKSNNLAKRSRKLKQLKESGKQLKYKLELLKYIWQVIKFILKLLKSIILSGMYILVIGGAVYFLYYGNTFFIDLLHGNNIENFESKAQEVVTLSIIFGLLIMYSEYFLFQPKNVLFNVEDSTKQNLKHTINDINNKCEAFKVISDWLKLKAIDAIERAKDKIEEIQKNDNQEKFLNFSKFETSDFIDIFSLCKKLKRANDSIPESLFSQFESETQDLLNNYVVSSTDDDVTNLSIRESLVREFNNLLEKPTFYEEERFKKTKLSKKTKILIQKISSKEVFSPKELEPELICLNRMLLEDSYPNEIIRKNAFFVTEELLLRTEEAIEGNHNDPIKGENIKLIKLKDRHTKSLDHFIVRGYATYEEIISEMNGIELYIEGLNKYETRLKELPAQIDLLINEIIIKSEKNT